MFGEDDVSIIHVMVIGGAWKSKLPYSNLQIKPRGYIQYEVIGVL